MGEITDSPPSLFHFSADAAGFSSAGAFAAASSGPSTSSGFAFSATSSFAALGAGLVAALVAAFFRVVVLALAAGDLTAFLPALAFCVSNAAFLASQISSAASSFNSFVILFAHRIRRI